MYFLQPLISGVHAFVNDLTEQVKSLYDQRSRQVSINWNIPETFILIDTAIPLGLILNELLTNYFKYAFNDARTCEIKMELNYLHGNAIYILKILCDQHGHGK